MPVLSVVGCGAPVAAALPDLVIHARDAGWEVSVALTPMAVRFADIARLEQLTALPVRTDFKHPGDLDVHPAPQALVVAPATFNTVNKIAHGLSDTLAVGLVCEALGADLPVIIAPWQNRALSGYPAYARSIAYLRDAGAMLVLTERTEPAARGEHDPGGEFPWPAVHAALAGVRRRAEAVRPTCR